MKIIQPLPSVYVSTCLWSLVSTYDISYKVAGLKASEDYQNHGALFAPDGNDINYCIPIDRWNKYTGLPLNYVQYAHLDRSIITAPHGLRYLNEVIVRRRVLTATMGTVGNRDQELFGFLFYPMAPQGTGCKQAPIMAARFDAEMTKIQGLPDEWDTTIELLEVNADEWINYPGYIRPLYAHNDDALVAFLRPVVPTDGRYKGKYVMRIVDGAGNIVEVPMKKFIDISAQVLGADQNPGVEQQQQQQQPVSQQAQPKPAPQQDKLLANRLAEADLSNVVIKQFPPAPQQDNLMANRVAEADLSNVVRQQTNPDNSGQNMQGGLENEGQVGAQINENNADDIFDTAAEFARTRQMRSEGSPDSFELFKGGGGLGYSPEMKDLFQDREGEYAEENGSTNRKGD